MNAHAIDIDRQESGLVQHLGITIDPDRDRLLTDFGRATLQRQYCLPDETCQQAFARASVAFCGGDLALAQRIYDYASKLWFMFASPLLANGGTDRGLPISCFLNYVDDSIPGLAENFTENAYLTTRGGGIGTYWGAVRSLGEITSKGVDTPGAMAFMHVQDAQILAYHQGKTRRGAAATYMQVDHPEIMTFITMRLPTQGDDNKKNENLHHGVSITDAFMEAVRDNLDWELRDPHSGRLCETLKARDIWTAILKARVTKGEPYLFFVDRANEALPQALKDRGLRVHHSNLCTEITLPTSPDRTAVCCLSSVNVAAYDEWGGAEAAQFIEDLVRMLDNVLDVFCEQAPEAMWRAVASARAERSIGLGTLGFHTYLQNHGVAMESSQASDINQRFYTTLRELAVNASRKLASERGEAPDMAGTGMRNAHLLAIAPNSTSSIICGGVSPSIEPMAANAFTQKTTSGFYEVRNPALSPVLERHGKNTQETWSSILLNEGSVQHLDFLSEEEKRVFRTARELDSMVLVELAAQRGPSICQAQSLNLFVPPTIEARELHRLHMSAWELGLKSLYYLRSSSVRSTNVGKTSTQKPAAAVCSLDGECKSCEG